MVINVAINGFGRIGRMVFRAAMNDKSINVVAVNDLTDNETLAHLLKYDSVHGRLDEEVSASNNTLHVGKKRIKVFSEKDPTNLPWHQLKIDVVVESTGFFRDPVKAAIHLKSGAKKVVISAPCKCETGNLCPANTTTIVLGVNQKTYNKKKHHIISNASCTTNCVAPIMKVLEEHIGVKRCFFTTIHGYTADQRIVDGPHKDLRRARAAAVNIVPTSTGADEATIEAIPSLNGKIRGSAIRVPTPDGSVTDFTIEMKKPVTVEQINKLFKKHASGKFKGIIQYSEDELVSTDIIGNPHSSIFDSKLTKVVDGKFLKVVSWYDNEWGYSKRMVDLIKLVS